MKTKTVQKMMGEEALRVRKTVRLSVSDMAKVAKEIAASSKTLAEARRKVEAWWKG